MQRRKLTLASIPWDTLNIIIDFTPKELYPLLRLNRQITKIVQKRLKGLNFKLNDVTEHTFFSLLSRGIPSLKHLAVTANLRQIKKSSFDKFPFKTPNLVSLEIVSLNQIGESALSRLITLCN